MTPISIKISTNQNTLNPNLSFTQFATLSLIHILYFRVYLILMFITILTNFFNCHYYATQPVSYTHLVVSMHRLFIESGTESTTDHLEDQHIY